MKFISRVVKNSKARGGRSGRGSPRSWLARKSNFGKKMVRREAMVAALALVSGTAAAYESSKLLFGTIHSPGPGFFPWWTSILIVLLALLLMVRALASHSSTAGEDSGRIAKVALLLVVLSAYTFLLDPLGYL